MLKEIALCGLTLASCTLPSTETETIEVRANDLGVVALQTTRFDDGSNTVYELRGLGQGDVEIGIVRLQLPTSSGAESEVLLTVDGDQNRFSTTERAAFLLPTPDAAHAREFVALAEVASVLERDANIVFTQDGGETPYLCPPTGCTGEGPPWATNSACPANLLLNFPVEKCCSTVWNYNDSTHYDHIVFVNDAGTSASNATKDGYKDIIVRNRNPYGIGCKAQDGLSTCYGANCYYGPLGYSRVIKRYGSASYPYPKVWTTLAGGCTGSVYSTPQTTSAAWTNVTGTSTARACPDQYGNLIVSDWDTY